MRRSVTEAVEVRYKVASLVLLTGAFLLLTGALADASEVRDLSRRSTTVQAEVTLGPGARTSTIEVQFMIPEGRSVTARTTRYESEVERGDQLTIEYDPQRPDRVQEVGWGVDYSAAFGFALSGLIALGLGIGCALRRWPRRIERPLFG